MNCVKRHPIVLLYTCINLDIYFKKWCPTICIYLFAGCVYVHGAIFAESLFYNIKYIEGIQVFGVNMSFISLSEVKIFYIS